MTKIEEQLAAKNRGIQLTSSSYHTWEMDDLQNRGIQLTSSSGHVWEMDDKPVDLYNWKTKSFQFWPELNHCLEKLFQSNFPIKFRGKFQEAEAMNKNPSYQPYMEKIEVVTPCMKLNKLGEI